MNGSIKILVLRCASCPFTVQLDDWKDLALPRCPACRQPMVAIGSSVKGIFCSRCGSRDVDVKGANAGRCRKCGWSWGTVLR